MCLVGGETFRWLRCAVGCLVEWGGVVTGAYAHIHTTISAQVVLLVMVVSNA